MSRSLNPQCNFSSINIGSIYYPRIFERHTCKFPHTKKAPEGALIVRHQYATTYCLRAALQYYDIILILPNEKARRNGLK